MKKVISVRFKENGKSYYFDPGDAAIHTGEYVIVETARGVECGEVVQGVRELADAAVPKALKPITRMADSVDIRRMRQNREDEKRAFHTCQECIARHGLEMKLVEAEYTLDRSKIMFYFTADGRVDFRELVKDLASAFRTRIELRQIGVRDKAKMVGGLGVCGRPFCCKEFLDDFQPVSIKMAKTQNLSLNPTKISGTCGRLMCCLKYEQDAYEDAVKRMPKNDSFVLTPDGPGNVSDVNLLKETVNVRLDDRTDGSRCYHNCEVCVLRNGKGSRDGIVIPDQRPERYVEPEKEDDMPPISFISDFTPPSEHGEDGGEKRRRRNRSGRGGKKSEGAAAPEKRTEKSARPDKPAKAERPAKPDKPEKADRPAAGDKQSPRQGGSRRRGRRGGSGAPAGANTSADITNTPPAAPRPPRKPQPEGQNGSGEQKKRPRHRGGRRRGGSGGNKPTSGSEV